MANTWPAPHQQGYVRYPVHHRGSIDTPCSFPSFRSPGSIHTRWYHSTQSVAKRNSGRHECCYPGLFLFNVFKDPMRQLSNKQWYYRIPGLKSSNCKHHSFHRRLCLSTGDFFLRNQRTNMRIGMSAVPTQLALLPLWTPQRERGLSPRKLRWVPRSFVSSAKLNSIRRMPDMHLRMGHGTLHWTLLGSR